MEKQNQSQEKRTLHYLETVKWGDILITNYNGCLVTKLIGGYSVFGRKVRTVYEVDGLIKDNQKSLTINRSVPNLEDYASEGKDVSLGEFKAKKRTNELY